MLPFPHLLQKALIVEFFLLSKISTGKDFVLHRSTLFEKQNKTKNPKPPKLLSFLKTFFGINKSCLTIFILPKN